MYKSPSKKSQSTVAKVMQFVEKLKRTRGVRAITHFGQNGGAIYSAGMSFQALFAVFAAVWLAFSLFGFFLRDSPELLQVIIDSVNTAVPGLLGDEGTVEVRELLDNKSLSISTLISAGSLLFVVVGWFSSTRTVVRIMFGKKPSAAAKNPIVQKLQDLAAALIFGALILVAALVTFAATQAMDGLADMFSDSIGDTWLFGAAGMVLRYALVFAVNCFILLAIIKWLAGIDIPFKRVLVGVMPGAAALVVLTLLSSTLMSGATKNPLLASFAVVIGLLVWFNFICRIMLLTVAWVVAGENPTAGWPEQAKKNS